MPACLTPPGLAGGSNEAGPVRPLSFTPGLEDPTTYPGWAQAVMGLANAGVFFSAGWARVLKESYGYRPMYLTGFRGGRLTCCLPVMEVDLRLTGKRGVALPFTDECSPLAPEPGQARELVDHAIAVGRDRGWRYFEMHGGGELVANLSLEAAAPSEAGGPAPSYFGHRVDLRRSEAELLKSLDGSIRRGIRTAQRENVEVEMTGSEDGMRAYYALHCLTRKRHGLPPQPWRFFEQVQRHAIGPEQGRGFIALARHGGRTIAGAVFLRCGSDAVYKYGASDLRFQALRPTNLLMWEAVRKLAGEGSRWLSLGRTSVTNEGLKRFKDGWGCSDYSVWYVRYDYGLGRFVPTKDASHGWYNAVFGRIPVWLLRIIGTFLYRYCG